VIVGLMKRGRRGIGHSRRSSSTSSSGGGGGNGGSSRGRRLKVPCSY